MDVTAVKVFLGPVSTGVTAVTAATAVTATGGGGEPLGFGRPGPGRPEPARWALLHPRDVCDASQGAVDSAVRA
ncbi:hypothetical protein ACIQVL_41775 [Streptomyces sp. NPDC090499]|uniref:hypothetical protein n=1 Tax=Streptomyces sp. NPDC090499 TaxID=3365965 RepID=UPI00381EDAF8